MLHALKKISKTEIQNNLEERWESLERCDKTRGWRAFIGRLKSLILLEVDSFEVSKECIGYSLLHDKPPQTLWLKMTTILVLFTSLWVSWYIGGLRKKGGVLSKMALFIHLAVWLALAIGWGSGSAWVSYLLPLSRLAHSCSHADNIGFWRAAGEGMSTCASIFKWILLRVY